MADCTEHGAGFAFIGNTNVKMCVSSAPFDVKIINASSCFSKSWAFIFKKSIGQKIHIHPRGEYLTLYIDISKHDLILLSSDSVPINTNIMAKITTIFTYFRANLAEFSRI